MNFCDDFHIYENFADLDKSMEFPMVDRLKVSRGKNVFSICVQKHEMTFVRGNITEVEKNKFGLGKFFFMQG